MRPKNILSALTCSLALLGCRVLESYRPVDYHKQETEKAQSNTIGLKAQIDSAFLGKTFWLKPRKEYDCDYREPLKSFSKIKIMESFVEVANSRTSTFKVTLIIENKKKMADLSSVVFQNNWSEELVGSCFYNYDPKKKYPMSQSDWSLIETGRFRIGFTRDQLSLALGRPENINRTVSSSSVEEQWIYDHKYFYFHNGALTSWQD